MALTLLPSSPPSRLDDAAAIELSWSDAEAFSTVFDRHVDAIHRYIARRLGGGVADDLVAETFAVAFQRRHTYDLSRPDARPWLYGIATNLVGGHRRAERRRLRALSREPAGTHPEAMADRVAARVASQGARADLARGLARLPSAQRDVVLLHAWADLGYAEIADALGIPTGTVRSRLSRARESLQRSVGAHAPDHGSEEATWRT